MELKRGLSGTVNGFEVSALGDTGSTQNAVSKDFAEAQGLVVKSFSGLFRLGNSKLVHSLGTILLMMIMYSTPLNCYG